MFTNRSRASADVEASMRRRNRQSVQESEVNFEKPFDFFEDTSSKNKLFHTVHLRNLQVLQTYCLRNSIIGLLVYFLNGLAAGAVLLFSKEKSDWPVALFFYCEISYRAATTHLRTSFVSVWES